MKVLFIVSTSVVVSALWLLEAKMDLQLSGISTSEYLNMSSATQGGLYNFLYTALAIV
jgi:hypothetical protein